MSDITRRKMLRGLAATVAAAGVMDIVGCQQVHTMVHDAKVGGSYERSALSEHEFNTLTRMTDLIIPRENGSPGAVDAEVATWIDMLVGANDVLKRTYTEGLAWMDSAMVSRGSTDFVSATTLQQKALLDAIAYRSESSNDQDAITFFAWVRGMTVDGFYTSRVGMPDIYIGNQVLRSFTVPAESLNYALKKSGLG